MEGGIVRMAATRSRGRQSRRACARPMAGDSIEWLVCRCMYAAKTVLPTEAQKMKLPDWAGSECECSATAQLVHSLTGCGQCAPGRCRAIRPTDGQRTRDGRRRSGAGQVGTALVLLTRAVPGQLTGPSEPSFWTSTPLQKMALSSRDEQCHSCRKNTIKKLAKWACLGYV